MEHESSILPVFLQDNIPTDLKIGVSIEMKMLFSTDFGLITSLLPLPLTDDNDFSHQDLRRNDGIIQNLGKTILSSMNCPKLYYLPLGRMMKKLHNITNSGTSIHYLLTFFIFLLFQDKQFFHSMEKLFIL